jgi:hypothetical protein
MQKLPDYKLVYLGYFQKNQWLNIKKHAIYNIYKLAWGPYVRGPPGNCPAFPCIKVALAQ